MLTCILSWEIGSLDNGYLPLKGLDPPQVRLWTLVYSEPNILETSSSDM